MNRLTFILNSNQIHSYIFKCIESLSKELDNVYIELFIDVEIGRNELLFSPIAKYIDLKFSNLSKNPLDYKKLSDLSKLENVKIITHYSDLNTCDYFIFETKHIIDARYKNLSEKGILTLDINYESIVNATLYEPKITLSLLINNSKCLEWNPAFQIELKKEKGLINNTNKILFNYSVYLVKFLKNQNPPFEPLQAINHQEKLKLKQKVTLITYYLNLTYIIIARKLSFKKLNWKIAIKNNDDFIFLKQPKKSFWADPFIIKQESGSVIFYEELNNNKGHISCVKLDDAYNVIENKIVLNKDYHLSFPNVFFKDNNYYMIPESSQNNDLQLYKCAEFPYKWDFEMNIMEGIKILDAIWLFHNGLYWIFANKIEDFEHDNNEKLYLYYSKDLFNNQWNSHIKNPIITDASKARNAGNFIFKNNKIYRVSQNCFSGYGQNLILNEIIELSVNNYEEVKAEEFFPPKIFKGMHTMNYSENLKVFDFLIKE